MALTEVPSLAMGSAPVSERDALIERVSGLAAAYVTAGEAPGLSDFIHRYYADIAPDDLADRRVEDLAGAARSHWRLASQRPASAAIVRVSNPDNTSGWTTSHTVIEIVTDDMPFLVDSVAMEIDRHNLPLELLLHPVAAVRRDTEGHLLGLATPDGDGEAIVESFIHIEIERTSDAAQLSDLCRDIERVLVDVRAATSDWPSMVTAMRRVIDDLARRPPPVAPEELIETRALLEWMADHHFTLLGYGEYELSQVDGSDVLNAVAGTGLGILRDRAETTDGDTFAKLPPELRRQARDHTLLVITKGNSRSTVHRPVYLDYVGVKRFDGSGNVIGEWRFLGLWTSAAYNSSPLDIPLLRHKVASVLRRAGYPPTSHSGKDLIAILETYPRDELFQIDERDLFDTALGILHLQERRRVRVFARRDAFGRFASVLAFVPRDRYNTALRVKIDDILQRAFRAVGSEWNARVNESVLARLHFVLRTVPGSKFDVDISALEAEIAAACRSWPDELHDALVKAHGDVHGVALARRYAEAFPPGYRDDCPAARALDDVACLERLDDTGKHVLRLDPNGDDGTMTFTVFTPTQLALSDVMPILANLGVAVVDEHPYRVDVAGRTIWIERFRLRALDSGTVTGAVRDDFEDAFTAVIDGAAENDTFGTLVLAAGLNWRETAMLRAYARYLRQIGTLFSQDYLAGVLAAHPPITRALVALFRGRFDPDATVGAGEQQQQVAAIVALLDDVASLDDDRILRAYLDLIQATLRTNWFQLDGAGAAPSHIAFKLDPRKVPDLPRPAPEYEIFVYSPRVEGVHLRMGRVARGGLRWSDRREDFRTEILGLVKAQTVKNAVIVPVGAKGGFVPKQLPPASDREAWLAEGVACYRIFVGGLLDLTDNLRNGSATPPSRVVRYDDDDPYLVVAADKGTATFSDIANEIAVSRGFWLGDAFASGGSVGYDHKVMGITARGAWESVRAHFRRLSIDVQTTDFTVVGIGDMSGDVFGNGMLLSPHIRLVAAFDHRHIFLDPNPDAATSLAERQRLFDLPRSSWGDYDAALLSAGGGIFARTAKSVTLTPEVRKVLSIDDSVDALTPAALISAILCAPVDLLWNGGIGTYVKAHSETHADVGDKTNDSLRVNGASLRCRVVGEGGNLGFTQRARIEFAQRGGLINTDAIDNSAGVDTSDHEVNIKILLDRIVASGRLSYEERNTLLASMTDEVAALVLADNYQQNRALANAAVQTASMADVHARYLRALEQTGRLDRGIEYLPGDDELGERHNRGEGLTVPELAVLLAYTKIDLERAAIASDLPDDPDVAALLEHYFPTALHDHYALDIASHPLRREIIATVLVNAMVNVAGTSLVFRLAEETGATPDEIMRAHHVAWRVFDQESVWRAIAGLDNQVAAQTQTAMYLESRKLVERGTRWFLRNRRHPIPLAATIAGFSAGVHRCSEVLPALLAGGEADWLESSSAEYAAQGVPWELARRVASLESLYSSLDIVDIATNVGHPIDDVAAVHTVVGFRLELDWLLDRVVDDLSRDDRWHALARNALRDDVYSEHRAITTAVLKIAQPGDSADSAFGRWIASHGGAVERAQAVLTDVRAHGVFDLATLSVVLRELRNLLD